MSQYTENYHLEKPELNDDYDAFITNYGNNMDIIDEHLGQGGGGSSVSWQQLQVTGDKIATIRISGIDTDVYSPNARTFSMAISRANIDSGENYSTIFGKIKKYFADLKTVAFTANTSDLTNDAGFITNTVNNLANYYLKSETYTQAEVNALIGAITTIHFEVVQTLPTSDIQTNVIYLVPKSTAGTNDVYDEYINMDGTSAGWELIGSTQVDLSNYYTKTQTDTLLDGKVSDVKVNDTSVVDSSHVANITSYEEVTIAQYNALPAEKKNCGIAYFIKDLDNASVEGYPPLIYSLEEREVGVWHDGKPVYQKTILNNSTNASGSNITINVSDLDIDVCVSINGICDRIVPNIGTLIYDMNTWEESQLHTCLSHSKFSGNIQYQIKLYTNESTSWQVITIQYTKNADTAGSGTWNGQGGLAHHYSTTEKIIGTWIDGKPIYECTFDISASPLTIQAYSWANTTISNSDIKRILHASGSNADGAYWGFLSANRDSGSYVQILNIRNTPIALSYFTLQYTKLSD